MASDLVDGDYLGSYRRFIVDFLNKVNPDDQLPIKTSGHDVSEGEMVGEIIHMTLQYLNQQLCPPSLQCYIVQLVIVEIKATCRKQPESCGFRQEEKTYAPLKLMQAVATKVNEICQRYLENSRLALLPPPPSTPMPLANAFAIRNNRRKMEDRHVILHDLNTIFNIKDDSIASYYAVFDGHAGYQAAVFCATHLHQYLAENRHYPTEPERALREAFLTTDEIFVQKSTRQTSSSGTTAVCALILNKKLYVAWAGDSQAALAKRGVITQLVNSHKPDRNDERERVEQMGGTVMHLGVWRVNGNLAVSRAIGDALYKPYVTGEPEIRCITLDGDEDFLIIGCDGLWDCVTENEAAALVYRDLCRDPYNYESASQRLVEFAKGQGSIDNITVIVVFLATPIKIASRYPHCGNTLLADVQLDNMEPDNRFLSNANGQFDVNSAFAKQATTDNGSPDLMDDEDPYGSYVNKSSNGKHHENGSNVVKSADYDAEEDDEDLGPETDVDALDDVSEPLPTLADVSRQLFPEKQDPCELYQNKERMDDETLPSPQPTKTNQQALIPETDNVGDSEDSEDEWNYYRIDPNKEKESAGAAGFSPEPKPNNKTREDIVGAAFSPTELCDLLGDEKNDEKNESDSSSESDSEREIRSSALIDNEISADTKFGTIPPSTTEEKADKEETEKFKPIPFPVTEEKADKEETEKFTPISSPTIEEKTNKEETDEFEPISSPITVEKADKEETEKFTPISSPTIEEKTDKEETDEFEPISSPITEEKADKEETEKFVPISSPTIEEKTDEEETEKFEPIPSPTTEEKADKEETEKFKPISSPTTEEKADKEETEKFEAISSPTIEEKADKEETEKFEAISSPTIEEKADKEETEKFEAISSPTIEEKADKEETEKCQPTFVQTTEEKADQEETEKFESILSQTSEEKAEKEETEKCEIEKETEEFNLEVQQDENKDHQEEMDFQLNPNAAEFVPVTPTPIITTRMEMDAPIAGSPLKQTSIMDDIKIPSRREFENEVRNRPCDIEEKSSFTNGQLLDELDDCPLEKPSTVPNFDLDESEVSSTKAEFGDESSFLTACEFQRTGVSNLDGSFGDSYSGFEDSGVDPMTKSFGPRDFMDLGDPVDLNAVHELTDADLIPEENEVQDVAEEDEKMNLENIKASEVNTERLDSRYNEESSIDPFSDNHAANILDSSSPVSSPSSPVGKMHFGTGIIENSSETPVSTLLEPETVDNKEEKSLDEVEIASLSSQPLSDEANVEAKLLEMDLEDRGSQDCGLKNYSQNFVTEEENSPKNNEIADFLSFSVPRDDFITSPVTKSLPVESPQIEEVDKLAESLDDLRVDDDSSTQSTVALDVQVLRNPLVLHLDNSQDLQNDISSEDIPDYQVAKAPDSPVDIISPLASSNEQKNNPFENADFGHPISFEDPKDEEFKFQHLEVKEESVESEDLKTQPEVEEPHVIPSEIAEVSLSQASGLKLSESLQEFTGLEEQLNPEKSSSVSNGLPAENLLEIQSEESKINFILPMETAQPAGLIVEQEAKEELTKEPLEDEKKVEIPMTAEPTKIEKENVVAAVVATVATVAAAGTVAAAATKVTKAKPTAAKTTVKSATPTKAPANKSTPTSPTKPAVAARSSSLTAAKKTASTTLAARPTKLETGRVAPAASKPSAAAAKSTTTSAPKTTGRLSAASPRTKSVSSSISKISSSNADKKPTTNGDATKTSAAPSKVSTTTSKAPSGKPLGKSSTARTTASTTTTTTATTARARGTSAAATSTLAKAQNKTTTGTVGTTTQRPKTAPTGGATTLATKSRLATTTKSPITEKQIKETANKQISSSRTSTTTTASKTSRTSVSSSTTTTTRRLTASKTTSSTSTAVAPVVPPPIRKPAPITRPGGKTVAATTTVAATAAASPTTNGKTHVTKTTVTNKTKVVVQNGVCTAAQDTKIVTSTTSNEDEDVPKKDLSPVEPPTDNQLIIAAD